MGPVRGDVWLLLALLLLLLHTPHSTLLLAVSHLFILTTPPGAPVSFLAPDLLKLCPSQRSPSVPPLVGTTHEPPGDTNSGKIPCGHVRSLYPIRLRHGLPVISLLGLWLLCTVLPIRFFVLILQLNPQL